MRSCSRVAAGAKRFGDAFRRGWKFGHRPTFSGFFGRSLFFSSLFFGGFFSGFDEEFGVYDPTTWMYEGGEIAASAGKREHSAQAFSARTGAVSGKQTGPRPP